VDAGKPAPDRFGITVSASAQVAWLDSPDAGALGRLSGGALA
jgi:hypothetical protein